jgi:transcriptional regulator with XRE-family HTH domain
MNLLRLKEVLKDKGISGKDLAERVEVHPQTISNIIQGSNFPKPELLKKISEELDIDIRELFISTKEDAKEAVYVLREGNYINIGEINFNQ